MYKAIFICFVICCLFNTNASAYDLYLQASQFGYCSQGLALTIHDVAAPTFFGQRYISVTLPDLSYHGDADLVLRTSSSVNYTSESVLIPKQLGKAGLARTSIEFPTLLNATHSSATLQIFLKPNALPRDLTTFNVSVALTGDNSTLQTGTLSIPVNPCIASETTLSLHTIPHQKSYRSFSSHLTKLEEPIEANNSLSWTLENNAFAFTSSPLVPFNYSCQIGAFLQPAHISPSGLVINMTGVVLAKGSNVDILCPSVALQAIADSHFSEKSYVFSIAQSNGLVSDFVQYNSRKPPGSPYFALFVFLAIIGCIGIGIGIWWVLRRRRRQSSDQSTGQWSFFLLDFSDNHTTNNPPPQEGLEEMATIEHA